MRTRALQRRIVPVASLVALLGLGLPGTLGGCASVYHTTASRTPTAMDARLEQRVRESIAAHEATLGVLDGILADLRETRRTRTRAGRVERLGDERIEAGQAAWVARKSIASIEDVVVLDSTAQIPPERSARAAEVMALLEAASDEIDSAMDAIEHGVERYAAGETLPVAAADRIGASVERARTLTAEARALSGS